MKSSVIIEKVSYPNRNLKVVANLFKPVEFDETKKYPAIVVGHPVNGVKEQTSGSYAKKLAEQGFVTVAFDASYQGESSGEPHELEDPAVRVEDFRCTVDFLSTLSYVDVDNIGVLGICGSGGYALNVGVTEHRFKAIAGVSAVDLGQYFRDGLPIKRNTEEMVKQTLDAVGKQRTIEANGGPIKYISYFANTADELSDDDYPFLREAYEYYKTPRGQHPNSLNKVVFTSLDKVFAFTAFTNLSLISPRPVLVVAGSVADTLCFSQQAYEMLKEPKELHIIEGASHVDLYDRYVDQVSIKLTEFFNKNLK